MHTPVARTITALILGSGLLLSGCSSASTAPTPDSSEVDSASTQPTANLSTCEQVIAGYIVQMPDGEFDVCPMETSYLASTGTLTGLPSGTADFGLSGFGADFTDSSSSLNHPASGASDGTNLAIADRLTTES